MTSPEPLFLQGSAGRLFALYIPASYIPASERGNRGVVLLPPFAEEMNLSRRMLRLQAAALAERGIAALIIDFFGTGDSAGDFGDATWEIWIKDVLVAADALRARGCSQIGLLGLRLSSILAAAAALQLPAPCFATVLWQPVVLGRTYLNEFLRIRALTDISGMKPSTTIAEMHLLLERGETVEVAGYAVNPKLAAVLNVLDLVHLGSFKMGLVTWFEMRRDGSPRLSAVTERCVAIWRNLGIIVEARSITGIPFWAAQDSRVVSELVTMTSSNFALSP
jgi:exosortase A-associated hydrolase 2